MPVCWTRRDGGWAADVWEWWASGCGVQDPMSGAWGIDWGAFAEIVPRAIRADDEARLEVVQALRVCAATMNNPNEQMFPDQDDAE